MKFTFVISFGGFLRKWLVSLLIRRIMSTSKSYSLKSPKTSTPAKSSIASKTSTPAKSPSTNSTNSSSNSSPKSKSRRSKSPSPSPSSSESRQRRESETFYLRTAFGLLDRDSDGHVTLSELQFMLRNLGIEVKDDLLQDLMKDASKAGNGMIDEASFLQWITKIQALQSHLTGDTGGDTEDEITRDLLAAFRVFDRDCNGFITRDELRSALEMIGEPVTDAQLSQVLALGDIDKDGKINYEEFVRLLL